MKKLLEWHIDENLLGWHGHVECMPNNKVVKKVYSTVEGTMEEMDRSSERNN